MIAGKISENKGAALLWVITLTTTMLIIAGVLLSLTTTELKITNSFVNGIRAYYLAESGAEYEFNNLYRQIKDKDNVNQLPVRNDASSNIYKNHFGPVYPQDYQFATRVSTDDHTYYHKYIYTIDSIGTYQKANKRVQAVFEVYFSGGRPQINFLKWNAP